MNSRSIFYLWFFLEEIYEFLVNCFCCRKYQHPMLFVFSDYFYFYHLAPSEPYLFWSCYLCGRLSRTRVFFPSKGMKLSPNFSYESC